MSKLNFIGCDKDYNNADIVIFGAPYDGTASFKPGSRFAPNAIRLDSDGIETYSPYLDCDIEDKLVTDIGDVEFPFGNKEVVLENIYQTAKKIITDNKIPFMIGGEHLVTLPSVKATFEKFPNLHIIHFDAHTDLRTDYLGEALSHATVLRRIHDLVGDKKIYQFGIRSGLKYEFEFAKEHNYIEKFTVNTVNEVVKTLKDVPIYLTIDLDVLDPSILPGTGTPEAGGLSFKELHNALLDLQALNIVGLDVVELAPEYDTSRASTAVAVKVIRELLCILK
ncbi:MAG: agmatinase [Candidatus Izemoplasma sp.]